MPYVLHPVEGGGHGIWNATIEGRLLSELAFDFMVRAPRSGRPLTLHHAASGEPSNAAYIVTDALGPQQGPKWRRSVAQQTTGRGFTDNFGITGPLPATDGQRIPLGEDDTTGPEIGTRLPDFTLLSSLGRTVSFHENRGDAKAAVVFYRSAVW